ncbi:MFS general substrate transporter, partial [Saccharata proteae CBS 121410]
NGGLKAWLQVLGAFCLYTATWGFVQSFGVFQSYYTLSLLSNHSTSDIAWIGSVSAFLVLLGGVLSGPLFDKGYVRSLNIIGTALIILGIMTTSVATKYYQIFLAQGIAVGIGSGCVFANSTAVVPAYFTSRRPLAMGLASLGSGIGGIIYPIIFHRLLPSIGFGWTVRVIGFVTLAILLIPCVVLSNPHTPGPARRLFDPSDFRDPVYTFTTIAAIFGFLGIYIPFYFLQIFAQTNLHTPPTLTFYLIPIMNAGSTVGRLTLSLLSRPLGPLNTYVLALLLSGITHLCWIAIHNTPGLLTFAFIYGFLSGGILATAPIVIADITQDSRLLGRRIGTSLGLASAGLLAGSPGAGALVDVGKGVYWGAVVLGGSVLLGA